MANNKTVNKNPQGKNICANNTSLAHTPNILANHSCYGSYSRPHTYSSFLWST